MCTFNCEENVIRNNSRVLVWQIGQEYFHNLQYFLKMLTLVVVGICVNFKTVGICIGFSFVD